MAVDNNMINEIIKNCTVEGNIVKLPAGQLERDVYTKVKAKLEGIGGKLKGGKTQGFVFDHDPAGLLASIANGEDINLKQDYQFFATPPKLADMMASRIPHYEAGMRVLEPSAGDGALVKAFVRRFGNEMVRAIECYEIMGQNLSKLRDVQGAMVKGMDFLTAKIPEHEYYDIIIANPPFSRNQDIDHIRKMYEVCKPGGLIITVASPSWTYGSQKKQVGFREWLQSINAHQEEIPAGTFKSSGTGVGAMLLEIKKQKTTAVAEPEMPFSETDPDILQKRAMLKDAVIQKLLKMEAKDLSDAEIDSCFASSVMPAFITDVAKSLRDKGLTIEEVRSYQTNKEEAESPDIEAGLWTPPSAGVDASAFVKNRKKKQPAKSQPKARACRVCGCTEDDCRQCIEKTGSPCYWVEKDLCSACAEPLPAPGVILDSLIQSHKEEEVILRELKSLLNINSDDMNFFKLLQQTVPGADITLRIKEKNGKYTISVVNNVGGQSNLQPLIVTGIPNELDDEFFKLIAQPVAETTVQLQNLEAFKASVKEEVKKAENQASPKPAQKPNQEANAEKKTAAAPAKTPKDAKQAKPQNKKDVDEPDLFEGFDDEEETEEAEETQEEF